MSKTKKEIRIKNKTEEVKLQEDISQPIPDKDNIFLLKEVQKDLYLIGFYDNPIKAAKKLSHNYNTYFKVVACFAGLESFLLLFKQKYIRQKDGKYKFNKKQLEEVIQIFTQSRNSSGNDNLLYFIVNTVSQKHVFNNNTETLNYVLDYPVKIMNDSRKSITFFNESISVVDWYSVPVIEKVHQIGAKYIKKIMSVLLSYYEMSENKKDIVDTSPFMTLLTRKLKGKWIYRIREIVDMIIARFHGYKFPAYNEYKPHVNILRYDICVMGWLRIKPSIVKTFEDEEYIDYEKATDSFKRKYNQAIGDTGIGDEENPIKMDKVKGLVKYFHINPMYMRIDMIEFGQRSGSFKHFIQNDPSFGDWSNGTCILSCFLLGCEIYEIEDLKCTIGIHINPSKYKKFEKKIAIEES